VAILKEADAGLPVGEVIRKHGISSASYCKWKGKYGGLDASELKRIKELEGQLAEFKQIVADLTLENKAMKELITNRFFRQPESVKQSRSGWRRIAPRHASLWLRRSVSGGVLPQAHGSGRTGCTGGGCAEPDRG
jgi:putative transposase